MKTPILVALVGSWLFSVAAGTHLLWQYKSAPGRSADAPADWPVASGLDRVPGLPTLVMIAHPRCPCTRASLGELNLIAHEAGDRVTTHVVFVDPDGTETGWELTDSWYRALEIPGARVVRDDGGAIAASFRAWTSGQILVYGEEGALRFNGGITSVRGHSGDNLGRQQVLAFVKTGIASAHQTAVFGCALHPNAAN